MQLETKIIEMSQRAKDYYFSLVEEDPSKLGTPLRLYLDGKGCDGFYYGICFDKRESGDLELHYEDLSWSWMLKR